MGIADPEYFRPNNRQKRKPGAARRGTILFAAAPLERFSRSNYLLLAQFRTENRYALFLELL
ncbi:hypothetical protein EH240_29300 [Mesorhizobium tamadayense]|uniref:Uncharacterized protein n=1 Tax=Mesorhizobium tamadayense TaxID=425306 RepID=A0A3P3F4I8_9HYPH|nr:hypothetical protein [Mesorhizobium tamadayense]RRH93521.1 hypothetical protein EH240_29300 [Mesorhizobium tamadayense]